MTSNKSAVTGGLSERSVLSATIINKTADPIHCFVEYQTVSGTDNEVIEFDIDGNGDEEKCEEKVHSTSTNTHDSSSSNVYPKVIYSIRATKSDGSKLKIMAPFDNVPHGNANNWKFIVDNDKIHSEKN
ncbi:unnamed protein product [Adineta steineri]|uniref:Uncharacterized protein n=1 Tax=Adineta steineri TaxID=433720 RepID=A0A818HVQ3_9BILA|nr:unnamed protein product [Adineta steineri]CAF3510374.1 unnamed protein product [Adineta steineri]